MFWIQYSMKLKDKLIKFTPAALLHAYRKAKLKLYPIEQRNFHYTFVLDPSLGPSLKEKVTWQVSEKSEVPKGELYKLWSKIPGAHKWHHYFPIYEKVFSNLRSKPIKILEIGVYKGASLTLWKNYFHKDSLIVGIDIDESCKDYDQPLNNIHVRIGSQAEKDFIDTVLNEFGEFDLIIDDGSHVVSHMIASFNLLYLNGLKEKGIYFVEDTHSNYWISHRDNSFSFVDYAKQLIDIIHFHYTLSDSEICFRLGNENRVPSYSVPTLTTMIDEIRFFDSIVVFYKGKRIVPACEHL
jgi:hypothetical protein